MTTPAADLLHPVLLHHIVNTLQWPGLRPLQEAAVEPLLAGEDALLLAPTASGKTEATAFPLLTRMNAETWSGTSVLYLCPLKSLLNNLLPRLDRYAGWLGRRAALWHGDVTASRRWAILAARPDLLLTTPESLESMLVSQNFDHRAFFAGLRAVAVDEVHAFAGDDRGWHLLAVLERLTHLIGRPVQRVGLSATCLFLARDGDALLEAAALLLLWGRGWVEPVVAPPEPRHIAAQQLLALCLQEHRAGDQTWSQWWNGLAPFDQSAEPILRHLIEQGYLDNDGGMLFIGPGAERRFGHRHFMDMTAVFTGTPKFAVLVGRDELGRVDPALLTEEVRGDRRLLLNGRIWRVTYIDWRRRRCFVEPTDGGGKARWTTGGWSGLGFELSRAMREVLLGAAPQ